MLKFDVCRYDGQFGAMFEQFWAFPMSSCMYVFRGRWGTTYQRQPTFRGGFASQHLNIFPTFRGEIANIQHQPLGECETTSVENLTQVTQNPNKCTPFWEKLQTDDLKSR